MRNYRHDIVLIPNALDLTKYSYRRRQRATPSLLWLRAFDDIYNPSLAVRVVAILAQEFPSVRLLMMGPDKGDGSREAMLDLARALGVLERVTCTGRVHKDEISTRLDQGDIFLNTTRVDNTPVSVLEAMACGLCVVSTNVGGIPYLLHDEQDALLVPADNPSDMAKAVRRLMTVDGLAERLSSNARRKVEQCDWSNVLPKWEKLLNDTPHST
jgi:glycosyltransferase involved in cell wall biosynthesis